MPEFPVDDNRGWTPQLVAQLEPPVLDLEEDYRRLLAFPADRHRFVLGLGGIPVGIATDSDGIADWLLEQYGCFAESTTPVVKLSLGTVARDAFRFRTLVGTLMTYIRGTDTIGKFREMAGYVDTERGEGRALIASDNYRQDLANYLRFVVDAMTPQLGAVLFHTSAIAHRGHAYLFFGPSTAGKSTLTRLSARSHEVMTDDMLVLRDDGDGIRAATCGFWGGETRNTYPTKRLDLGVRAFFRLRKSPTNQLRQLPAVTATVELVCGIPGLIRPQQDQHRMLEFAARAARAVPVYELGFHKEDDSFWSLIDEQLG